MEKREANSVTALLELFNAVYDICDKGYKWQTFTSKNIADTGYPFVELIELQYLPNDTKTRRLGAYSISVHIWNKAEDILVHHDMMYKLYSSMQRLKKTGNFEVMFDVDNTSVTSIDDTSTGSVLKHAVIIAQFKIR